MIKKLRAWIVIALCLSAGCKCPWSKADDRTHQTISHTVNQSSQAKEKLIKHITNNAEFNEIVLKSSKLVIVDFHATWCGPCKTMEPIYKALAQQFENHVFAKLDVDQAKDVPRNYGIEGVPSFLFFKDGKEIKDKRIVGAVSKNKLEETINSLGK